MSKKYAMFAFACFSVIFICSGCLMGTCEAFAPSADPAELPNGKVGQLYEVVFFSTYVGNEDYSPVLTGELPNGISWIAADSKLSGTPQDSGTFPVHLDARFPGATGCSNQPGSYDYSLVIDPN